MADKTRTFNWSQPTLPVLKGWGYSASLKCLPIGDSCKYQWFSECGFAFGIGYAETIEDAQRWAERWIAVEMERRNG